MPNLHYRKIQFYLCLCRFCTKISSNNLRHQFSATLQESLLLSSPIFNNL